jgi:hypothetical protein
VSGAPWRWLLLLRQAEEGCALAGLREALLAEAAAARDAQEAAARLAEAERRTAGAEARLGAAAAPAGRLASQEAHGRLLCHRLAAEGEAAAACSARQAGAALALGRAQARLARARAEVQAVEREREVRRAARRLAGREAEEAEADDRASIDPPDQGLSRAPSGAP